MQPFVYPVLPHGMFYCILPVDFASLSPSDGLLYVTFLFPLFSLAVVYYM